MKKIKPTYLYLAFLSVILLFINVMSYNKEAVAQDKGKNIQQTSSAMISSQTVSSAAASQNASAAANGEKNQAAKDNESSSGIGLVEWFVLGGVFMWPLLLFSIITLAVIIERLVVFAGFRFSIKKFGLEVVELVRQDKLSDAIEVCRSHHKNFGASIFEKALGVFKRGIPSFEKTVETASAVKTAALEKNLNILSTMGNLAPLTGFLGTVSGMITAFKTIAMAENVTARLVAGGIYEALITTEAGLVIAILAVGANNFFVHRVDRALNEIEETANSIIETCAECNKI